MSRPDPLASPGVTSTERTLASPVSALGGVGSERVRQLERLGRSTISSLLFHAPRRYEDRRKFTPIRELQLGVPATVYGKIVAAGVKRFRGGSKSVFEFVLDDGTARLHCRWWNLPFLERLFAVGDDVLVYGRPNSLRPRAFDHPETEKLEPGEDAVLHFARIVPVYPLTDGLPQRVLRGLIFRAVEAFAEKLPEPLPSVVPTVATGRKSELPWLTPVAKRIWPTVAEAVRALHFPESMEAAEVGRQRLALDEFVALQFSIQRRRRNLERSVTARPSAGTNVWMKPFLASLSFSLTAAQKKVLREIRTDLAGPVPMRRLLQGDVGSGKTLVAAGAALMTLESGWNVALMAPTEILAAQLHRNFSRWFHPLGIEIGLRTGANRMGLEELPLARSEAPRVIIGTHALLEDSLVMDRLGLVIIDEQHKFGVAQRETLVRKGRTGVHSPHLLVMTATPIPRTLGLTLYGDLDVSIIDQLPSGRGRIRTHVRAPEVLPKVWSFIAAQLAKGRQAYVVYPRVNESEHDDVKAVKREFDRVKAALAPYRVGLLHGQLAAADREATMAAFRQGELAALVATSVIEVGVDVPNATVMLIENAEQFGLAQLHQLRGRIGRGPYESHCILVADQKTDQASARLQVMTETTDGFALAEADFRLRGPGELVGRVQSGLPDFQFGNLSADRDLVELARELVRRQLALAP